jgi:hypothetical protein
MAGADCRAPRLSVRVRHWDEGLECAGALVIVAAATIFAFTRAGRMMGRCPTSADVEPRRTFDGLRRHSDAITPMLWPPAAARSDAGANFR